MLFHSSLRKELSRSFGATLLVLFTIVLTMMLIRTLGLASKGRVDPSDVFLVMAYTSLGYLPTILSLSLFIAIVATLSRMYRDSEMVIWFSAGRGLGNFVKPLFQFAWPVLILVGALSFVGWPWANSQTQGMRDQFQSRGDIDRVAPGEFQESPGRNRVFFIDKDTAEGTTASNIFISSIERNLQITTSARSGNVETIKDTRYLVLRDGQRVERALDKTELTISEFDQYGARVGGKASTAPGDRPPRALPTTALLANPVPPNLGQLSWRIGMILAAINFVLMALTVTSVNPRVGRSGNTLFALFAFVIYYNLLNLGESWIGSGRFSIGGFMLALHLGALLGTLLWLAKRHNNWGLPRLRGKTAPATATSSS